MPLDPGFRGVTMKIEIFGDSLQSRLIAEILRSTLPASFFTELNPGLLRVMTRGVGAARIGGLSIAFSEAEACPLA
jgi:hypothetical protein